MTIKIFIPILIFVTNTVFAQTQSKDFKSVDLTNAEKATISLSNLYGFSGEQALSVKQIEIAKFKNLSDIEVLKTTDIKLFIQKRLTAAGMAEDEIREVLDEHQRILFDKKTVEKTQKLNVTIASWQKQKISESVINQKLAALTNDEL